MLANTGLVHRALCAHPEPPARYPCMASPTRPAGNAQQYTARDTATSSGSPNNTQGWHPDSAADLPVLLPSPQCLDLQPCFAPALSHVKQGSGTGAQWAQLDSFSTEHGGARWLGDDEDGQQSQGMQLCMVGTKQDEHLIGTFPKPTLTVSTQSLTSRPRQINLNVEITPIKMMKRHL